MPIPLKRKVVQMLAAPGWSATFSDDETQSQVVVPLVGWALVEDADGQKIVGLIAEEEVKFCDTEPDFTGYVNLQDMMAEAMEQMDWLEDDDEDDGFDDDMDELPPPPPPAKRKGGRLN